MEKDNGCQQMAVGPKEKKTTMKLGMNEVSVGKQQGQKPLKERRKKKKKRKKAEVRKHFLQKK